jgi:hypothetical protein
VLKLISQYELKDWMFPAQNLWQPPDVESTSGIFIGNDASESALYISHILLITTIRDFHTRDKAINYGVNISVNEVRALGNQVGIGCPCIRAGDFPNIRSTAV